MGGEMTDIDGDYYDENTSMTDTKMMLDWIYENIRYKVIATADQTIGVVDVVAGQGTEKLRLVPEKETSALVPSMVTPASVMFETVEKPENLIAPIKAGDVIAKANVYFAGRRLATVNLVAADTIKLSFAGLVISAAKKIIGSTFFMVLTLIFALVALFKFLLDLKDFFDKERRKSFDPLPSSFEVLTGKIAKVFTKKDKKKKGGKKTAGVKAKKAPAGKKAQGKQTQVKNAKPTVKKTRPANTAKPTGNKTKSGPRVADNVNKNNKK